MIGINKLHLATVQSRVAPPHRYVPSRRSTLSIGCHQCDGIPIGLRIPYPGAKA
jgi:hypothetical protein